MILTPFLDDYDVIVYAGDCIDVMRELPEASVDAVVTDPPYGLEFMGKDWDAFGGDRRQRTDPSFTAGDRRHGLVRHGIGASYGGDSTSAMRGFQAFSESWAREAYRVLKPGGHLLAFAGTRTYHRMAAGVEDAGFEIRDCIAWMYGSGFPKSLDVSKAIDKAAGAEREVTREVIAGIAPGHGNAVGGAKPLVQVWDNPASQAAREWSGWGTALKPAFEPVVVARKPLIGTVAQNVLEHGTGAINVDGCRIGWAYDGEAAEVNQRSAPNTRGSYRQGNVMNRPPNPTVNVHAAGRWPANVALDETAASVLDEQSGERSSSPFKASTIGAQTDRQHVSFADLDYSGRGYSDNGGASRFFYTAKASRQDRNVGGLADNTHPTVKPTDLMRWLIRLVTPPGGIILDPFGGSGSTGLAARAENVRCILIEREDEYLQIIKDRLAQLSLFSVPEDAA